MYTLYIITNTQSGTVYFGITKRPVSQRWSNHKHCALVLMKKTKMACAIRKYGVESFTTETLHVYDSQEECGKAEQDCIAFYPGKTYNLAAGGQTGFDIRKKGPEAFEAWKERMRVNRVGKTPFKGKTHSEASRKVMGACSTKRWDRVGRYPSDITDLPFMEAHAKHGISRTHYYRIKRGDTW